MVGLELDVPVQAIRDVCAWIDAKAPGGRDLALIGSSLGGFYATWLAEKYGARAVLVNPAVRPFEDLVPFLGPQRNPYSGETYDVTRAHFDELAALAVARITRPERYFLLLRTGDAVLDWRAAAARSRLRKSPAEMVAGVARLVEDFQFPRWGIVDLSLECRYMGHDLMNPPSVEGWHTGKEWIDTGILVERGSILSHSAVVARELGKPAIIGIPGLLSTLREGERVRIDGRLGTVVRLEA